MLPDTCVDANDRQTPAIFDIAQFLLSFTENPQIGEGYLHPGMIGTSVLMGNAPMHETMPWATIDPTISQLTSHFGGPVP